MGTDEPAEHSDDVAGTPVRAQQAARLRRGFAASASPLASTAVDGRAVQRFAPAVMTTLATWFVTEDDDDLVVVLAPHQAAKTAEEVLAYALAWQHDRRLVLVAPQDDCAELLARLAWFDTEYTVVGYDEHLALTPLPARSRESVRADRRTLPLRGGRDHTLSPEHESWLEPLASVLDGTDRIARPSYVSWHDQGRQVLRARSTRTGLLLDAGVQFSTAGCRAPGAPEQLSVRLLSTPDATTIDALTAVVAHDRSASLDVPLPVEHKLQAALAKRQPLPLGLVDMLREYPAFRGPGRPGFIDFLGIDPAGVLHVVETKVGHDPTVVLQALGYVIWVEAHEDAIRVAKGWPVRPDGARVRLDLLLAGKPGRVAVNPYLAGQLEALPSDVPWSLSVVPDADDIRTLEALTLEQLWEPSTLVAAPVAPRRGTGERPPSRPHASYARQQRRAAARWKATTASLPDAARAPGPYRTTTGDVPLHDFCLPVGYAAHTLLPEVRDDVLRHFRKHGIVWQGGIGGGPGTHLLSSQVQCANALGQLLRSPDGLPAALIDMLHIERLLPFDDGSFVRFEYVDVEDVLNECAGGKPTPGAYCTSLDAALLYETTAGRVELALVEWKYTERYSPSQAVSDHKRAKAQGRYYAKWQATDGPIDPTVLDFDDVLVEPFYQLVRQQLLAQELEKRQAHSAEVVRVVHVSPRANTAYRQSLTREAHRRMGSSVSEVWQRMLRPTHADRFLAVDSSVFLDDQVTSAEYVARYR